MIILLIIIIIRITAHSAWERIHPSWSGLVRVITRQGNRYLANLDDSPSFLFSSFPFLVPAISGFMISKIQHSGMYWSEATVWMYSPTILLHQLPWIWVLSNRIMIQMYCIVFVFIVKDMIECYSQPPQLLLFAYYLSIYLSMGCLLFFNKRYQMFLYQFFGSLEIYLCNIFLFVVLYQFFYYHIVYWTSSKGFFVWQSGEGYQLVTRSKHICIIEIRINKFIKQANNKQLITAT